LKNAPFEKGIFMNSFARKHSVLSFLLINFAWTWLFWLAAIPLRGQDLLITAIVMIGGFGPAIGGILTLGLKAGWKPDFSSRKLVAMVIASLVVFAFIALRYLVGNIPEYDTLATNLTLTPFIVVAALIASLVGGWVYSSALSRNVKVRERMGSILPWRLPAGWTILGLLFYPAMILVAWGLATLIGADVEYPGLWGQPLTQTLPLYALTFSLTFLAQGGNEEPGWRGLMQPELQKRFSPLVAALMVSVAWSLWHLPLYLNGFYPGDLVGGMLGGFIFRILLSIFLAWFYNRSGGNLFLMMFLHTSFNTMVNFLPTSDLGLLVLWLVVVMFVIIKDKMWRKIHDLEPG
jgi:membrane protease YdiL (CAAX protease family)